ncbi:predicted protein [Chaetomium globosum CBS 148.51]|uniref:Uncharacterized protein n=1 Tax=Chaetomium globosum (strain ATCC 6205 / CBS 148.51 / DSM 1962 / NBRC 6347 / NRRL 1970) TaxID=306901 RepID=Q2HFN3_CHAGB|nr:uncharacterized protein CHGG_00971 [Chaetomium globosum CBS 148.51]EAQ92736.1 predicted protein [Chaetomium globosum CBS 148.51]
MSRGRRRLLRGSRRPGSGGLCQAFGGIPTQPPSTSLPITGVPIIAAREKEAIDAFRPVKLRKDMDVGCGAVGNVRGTAVPRCKLGNRQA